MSWLLCIKFGLVARNAPGYSASKKPKTLSWPGRLRSSTVLCHQRVRIVLGYWREPMQTRGEHANLISSDMICASTYVVSEPLLFTFNVCISLHTDQTDMFQRQWCQGICFEVFSKITPTVEINLGSCFSKMFCLEKMKKMRLKKSCSGIVELQGDVAFGLKAAPLYSTWFTVMENRPVMQSLRWSWVRLFKTYQINVQEQHESSPVEFDQYVFFSSWEGDCKL